MSVENIKKLLDKADADQNLKDQLKGADLDTIIAIAKDNDIEIVPEDFEELTVLMEEPVQE